MNYLHTIGLENFRLFKDPTSFELAPITILTGINNSGKSSLIKSLQLFKSSIKATGRLDELNFTGGRHNLGSFKTAFNRNNESGLMRFRFDFPLRSIKEKTFLELDYREEKGNPEFGQLVKLQVVFESGEMIVKGALNLEDEFEKLLFFDFEFLNGYFSKIFNPEYFQEKRELNRSIEDPNWTKEMFDSLELNDFGIGIQEAGEQTIFDSFYFQNVDPIAIPYEDDGCYQIFKGFENYTVEEKGEALTQLERLKTEGFVEPRSNEDINIVSFIGNSLMMVRMFLESSHITGNPKYPLSSIMNYVFEDFLKNEVLVNLKGFCRYFESVSSLSSVRANSERLYSNDSDIVDINSLLIDFSRITLGKDDPIQQFIDRSMQRFNIGEKILIRRYQGKATEIFAIRDGSEVMLADLGFGFTQLVPIILKIAVSAKRKETNDIYDSYTSSLFLLEEPESNLHPSYQSKLAELILDAAKSFNIQFIIETHSEYLIRNLQYLTATKTIKPRDTKIYYFHQPGSEDFEESPYRVIEIMKDGRLSNEFGEGFFDEIPRLLAFLYNSSFN